VLALGSEAHFFGVKGAAERAFPLRWMDDAIPLRNRVLVLLNWAWNYVTFRRSVRLILPGARGARGPGRGGGW
jgi:NADH dehydrogenase FAD-containing subunit